MKMRYENILQMFQKYKPDIICLQEVVPYFVELLVNNNYVRENYFVHHVDPYRWTISGYGTYILSTIPFRLNWYRFTSKMDRNLQVGIFKINDELIYCGNVHLESLGYPEIRKSQLNICNQVLNPQTTSLLMGDFNIGSDKNFSLVALRRKLISKKKDPFSVKHSDLNEQLENDVLNVEMPDFSDIWTQINPNDSGYTFNSLINPMLYAYEEMRYDRMMYKSSNWIPISIEIVANEPIGVDKNGNHVFPSDHFGLFMTMQYITS